MNLGHIQTERAMGAVHQQDHADSCCCRECVNAAMKATAPETTELIHVGLPFLKGPQNGYCKARVQDGEVRILVCGEGSGELMMGKREAEALRDQLNAAIATI